MPFSLTVVLAATYVDRGGALEAGNAVARVEAEPQVADLQSSQLRDSEAADGRKGNHEPIPVVPDGETPKAKHGSYKEAVHREKEGGGAADQARQTAGPCG
jgi:hypothetical protein